MVLSISLPAEGVTFLRLVFVPPVLRVDFGGKVVMFFGGTGG
jgi:hypothetical protein